MQEENLLLKQFLAELPLDKAMLQDLLLCRQVLLAGQFRHHRSPPILQQSPAVANFVEQPGIDFRSNQHRTGPIEQPRRSLPPEPVIASSTRHASNTVARTLAPDPPQLLNPAISFAPARVLEAQAVEPLLMAFPRSVRL